ncbi:SLAC1 anion channel family protein [Paraburkholderia bonniea]|uniref:SLAC1 anion channel family protein n=1 Tax=Paraburkholderia bonniea TaxID=2152891 RepID=UPI001291B1BA|nr:SLAC1 anion channel family protein [Paraburkholderia bonniea]WJF89072.1 SLAC1 anion channel family protein [Paraburkholderia bonniea]WJF92388.1 SLAC1 anion channel family protein [Paraburkholderia bonniea]
MTANSTTMPAPGTQSTQNTQSSSPLSYLPVSLFGAIMGLCGLALAWRIATQHYGVPEWISEALSLLAVLAFSALVVAYAIKWVCSPAAVRNEFQHPVAANFFGTAIISILLLPAVIAPWLPHLARVVWLIGAALMIVFAWLIVNRWTSVRQQIAHATPAWIIPPVGTLDIPIAGVQLQLPGSLEVSVFALAVGLFFTVPVFTMILSRLIFEEPLPPAFQPSLLILVAPFAVGFSSYVNITGHVDLFASALFYLAVFIFMVLLPKMLNLRICCPFRVSWWAVSFPLAALTIASLRFAAYQQSVVANAYAITMLALCTLVLGGLAVRTLTGILRGELKTLTL